MPVKIKAAKFLMNLMPRRPVFDLGIFQQEYFNHPKFKNLDEESRKQKMIEWVGQNISLETQKPFTQYYPDFPFNTYFKNKIVLDIGCSIGGQSIYFAEKGQLKAIYGIDVNKESITAANFFIQYKNNLNAHYEFKFAYAEDLPFDDNTFDAIISRDTIEHVRDVKQTLEECKRVTKMGGMIFLVFPSYYFPFGGAHLGSVSRTPFLEWFFSADTLNKAFHEIKSNWSDKYNWYDHESDMEHGEWKKVESGIGINGITYREFNNIANKVGFSRIEFIRTPLLSVSFISNRYPIIRYASQMSKPLLRIKSLVDYLSHRFVYVITV